MHPKKVTITDYLKYRCKMRGFDTSSIEYIVRHSSERYYDTETRRNVVVGNHKNILVLIPFEESENEIKPITVHAISRKQIRFRLNTGRLK